MSALAIEAAKHDTNRLQMMVSAGGIEAVVGALNAHRSSAVVQSLGCLALACFADNRFDSEDVDNQGRIEKCSAVESVLGALRTFPKDVEIQDNAFKALNHFFDLDGVRNQGPVGEKDGADATDEIRPKQYA